MNHKATLATARQQTAASYARMARDGDIWDGPINERTVSYQQYAATLYAAARDVLGITEALP